MRPFLQSATMIQLVRTNGAPSEVPPPDAVKIWVRGDKLFIQFEGHTVDIPCEEPRRLITVLKAREVAQLRQTRLRLGDVGCPPQLQIYDAYKEALKKSEARVADETAMRKEKRAKEIKAAAKRYDTELKLKEMDELMEAAGL